MKRYQNVLLIIAVVLLAALPLWLVQKPPPDATSNGQNGGKPVEIFGGADNQARDLIGRIAPNYKPWFAPVLEPASNEIASLLFALQAALGAGFIGYYLGVSRTREKMRHAVANDEKKAESPNRAD